MERIKEYGRSTLAKFYILDNNGEHLPKYDGYIIEPEAPDEIRPEKNRRIPTGVHNLQWHYRGKPRNYWAISIYNHEFNERGLHKKYLHEDRYILIHYGGGRRWSTGCLIPARNPSKGVDKKYGKIYVCELNEDSLLYFNDIKSFIHSINNTESGKVKYREKIKKIVF